ncbi:MAG: heparan-alpha-glucosaminide N-acetyltransferase domain-containing protein [Promethearchaeota archaeon]
MKLKRYNSIDTLRGVCMVIMIGGHLWDWWLTTEDYWFFILLKNVFGIWGATGFVFISGVSTFISYRHGMKMGNSKDKAFMAQARKLYMLRAFFILGIALIYNTCIAIAVQNPKWIWTWFVLQTIAVSLIMAWPLLKTSKIVRIGVAIILFGINQILFVLLSPYQGQLNTYGVLYHIFFNPIDQYIILSYFSVFLIGTVIGETLYEFHQIKDPIEMRKVMKSKLSVFILLGTSIMIFGIVYDFPLFFEYGTFPSIYYSLGLVIILLSILIFIEKLEIITTKERHRFFSFYSYYSFTIYLAHYPLYFLFYRQLNVIVSIIALAITAIIMTYLLFLISRKVGKRASLKFGITTLSFRIVMKLEKRKSKRNKRKN